jgi:hypothetical protein
MDFSIENQLVINDLDVVAVAGGIFTVYIVTTVTPIFIRDGTVTFTMRASVDAVILSAVEVMASANIVTHRINCGSSSNTPVIMNNVSWTKDVYALSGATSNRCTANNVTNSIYCSSRYFSATIGTPLRYNIPVPTNNALYALRLHFYEQVNTSMTTHMLRSCGF